MQRKVFDRKVFNRKLVVITGGCAGIGRALAVRMDQAGARLVIFDLHQDALDSLVQHLADHHNADALGLCCDVSDAEAVQRAIALVVERYGGIDVLVNNAGYGHEGVLEESSLADLRQQFEVNVFGPAALIKAVLPHMRARRRGHILNITSMGGFITMPGIAWYCGSKFALEGISEVLAKEVAGFGIHVTAVAPGSFRTDWAGRSMVRSPRAIEDYDALFDPIRSAREAKSGQQLGDPMKAAQAMLQLIDSPAPPAHLLLGSDAVQLVRGKLQDLAAGIEEWEGLSRSTDG